jgi:cytochrome c oxidase subunit 4
MTTPAKPHAHAEIGHPVPMKVLAGTLAALLLLTVITVGATWVDFGAVANLWIALIIATIKAILVALFFMHLAYDRPFNAVVLAAALFFVLLFVCFTLMDTRAYQDDISAHRTAETTRSPP